MREAILSGIVSTLNDCGIKDISVVVGYKKEAIDLPNVRHIENNEYDRAGLMTSLHKAKDELTGDVIITYGDVLYEHGILRELMEAEGDIVLVVDTSWCQEDKQGRDIDLVVGSEPYSPKFGGSRMADLLQIGIDIPRDKTHGEWIGLMKLSDEGCALFKSEMELLSQEEPERFKELSLVDFLLILIKKGIKINIQYVYGQWFDIDSIEDISDAYSLNVT